MKEHAQLMHHLGRLRALQSQIDEARRKLHERAGEQLDSIPEVQEHVEAHIARGKGGGPLAHRQHRRLLVERARLHHVLFGRGDDGA